MRCVKLENGGWPAKTAELFIWRLLLVLVCPLEKHFAAKPQLNEQIIAALLSRMQLPRYHSKRTLGQLRSINGKNIIITSVVVLQVYNGSYLFTII